LKTNLKKQVINVDLLHFITMKSTARRVFSPEFDKTTALSETWEPSFSVAHVPESSTPAKVRFVVGLIEFLSGHATMPAFPFAPQIPYFTNLKDNASHFAVRTIRCSKCRAK
jgi:hypothetical protein